MYKSSENIQSLNTQYIVNGTDFALGVKFQHLLPILVMKCITQKKICIGLKTILATCLSK